MRLVAKGSHRHSKIKNKLSLDCSVVSTVCAGWSHGGSVRIAPEKVGEVDLVS